MNAMLHLVAFMCSATTKTKGKRAD